MAVRKKGSPTQSELHEWFSYNEHTGEFVWIKEPAIVPRNLGSIAGTVGPSGYTMISVGGRVSIGAHRLAWIFKHGDIPDGMEIDHTDGNPANNAISNLRLANRAQQGMNKRTQSNNKCGLKGASFHKRSGKWRAQIKVGPKKIMLGTFDSAENAHQAYVVAASLHFGAFYTVRSAA